MEVTSQKDVTAMRKHQICQQLDWVINAGKGQPISSHH